MAFCIFIMLYNHLVPRHFPHPKRNPPLSNCSPFFPPPTAPANANLPSASMGLPILDISYKRNRTIYVLLCLASFTQHDVSEVQLVVACVSASFILWLHNIPWYVYTTFLKFIYHLVDILMTVDNTIMNICVPYIV
uniref:Uncharacterized protein n=1 Tax=Myotis myotis TaxID=51298 RepID=A0A7J7XHU6_MYOMY|nr:hypothetical protein mMyoMyo1_011782 [Myotis myotis]